MLRECVWAICLVVCGIYSSCAWAGQGCCSYHGGVSGCSGGGLGCADGTLSPSCGCSGSSGHSVVTAIKFHEPNPSRAQKAVETAVSRLGTPYKSGGSDKNGTDCSGLVQQAIPDYFPRRMSASDQLHYLEAKGDESVPAKDLQPGDLVYFSGQHGKVSHAAIVENVDPTNERPIGIITASSNKNHYKVMRESLGQDGSLGKGLGYAGGGRPR